MSRRITGTRIFHRAPPPAVDADLLPTQNQAGDPICVWRESPREIPPSPARLRSSRRPWACRREPTIAGTEPDLRFPGDVADNLWKSLEPVVQLAADAGLHSISPSPFDQDTPCKSVACLSDAAAADCCPTRMLGRRQTKVSHHLARIVEAVKSPTSATTVTAATKATPRIAWNASTTGAMDQVGTRSSICFVRRAIRSSASCTEWI